MIGKEAALLTPTGVMANLISFCTVSKQRGDSVIIGSKSHFLLAERGALSVIGGILPKVLDNKADGTIAVSEIQASIPSVADEHICPIVGISLESSHNGCGGRVLPLDYIKQVKKVAKKNKIMLHLDGARVWNAAVALDM